MPPSPARKAKQAAPAVVEEKPIRLTLELSPALNSSLEALAERTHGTKSEVLRKAIAIMEVAVRAKEKGATFGIAKAGQSLETEVVGI